MSSVFGVATSSVINTANARVLNNATTVENALAVVDDQLWHVDKDNLAAVADLTARVELLEGAEYSNNDATLALSPAKGTPTVNTQGALNTQVLTRLGAVEGLVLNGFDQDALDILLHAAVGSFTTSDSVQVVLNDFQTRLTAGESADSAQNARLDAIESVNTTQSTAITGIQTVNTTQNGRLDAIELVNSAQNGRLDEIEGAIDPLTLRVEAVENVNATQATAITALQSTDSSHNSRLTALETATVNASAVVVSPAVSSGINVQTSLTNIASRVTTLESGGGGGGGSVAASSVTLSPAVAGKTNVQALANLLPLLFGGALLVYPGAPNSDNRYTTIAAALALAVPDQTVFIAAGVYNEKNLTIPQGSHVRGLGFVKLASTAALANANYFGFALNSDSSLQFVDIALSDHGNAIEVIGTKVIGERTRQRYVNISLTSSISNTSGMYGVNFTSGAAGGSLVQFTPDLLDCNITINGSAPAAPRYGVYVNGTLANTLNYAWIDSCVISAPLGNGYGLYVSGTLPVITIMDSYVGGSAGDIWQTSTTTVRLGRGAILSTPYMNRAPAILGTCYRWTWNLNQSLSSGTNWLLPGSSNFTDGNQHEIRAPYAMIVWGLEVSFNVAPSTNTTITFMAFGGTTPLSCTAASGQTTAQNNTNIISLSEGNTFGIRYTGGNGAQDMYVSVCCY